MHRSLTLALYLFSAVAASADGFPFNYAREVTYNHLRLKLTAEQELETATWGRVTLDKQQLALLRAHYPKIPSQLRVIAATFNDGLDLREPNPVDCLWTAPHEIAVTLREKRKDGDFSFDDGERSHLESDLRISPKGQLFHFGKEITREQALDLIANATRPEGLPDAERTFTITKAPPYRSENEEFLTWNKKVTDLFNAFVQYGAKHEVTVHGMW